MEVRVIGLGCDTGVFGSDVLLVHPDDASFELFVFVDARKHVIDILLELPLDRILLLDFHPQFSVLKDESLHLHLQISYNQLKIRLDPREVFDLLAHLRGLLFQSPRSLSIRLDILLELLNLVIQHELKLLQLLGLQF